MAADTISCVNLVLFFKSVFVHINLICHFFFAWNWNSLLWSWDFKDKIGLVSYTKHVVMCWNCSIPRFVLAFFPPKWRTSQRRWRVLEINNGSCFHAWSMKSGIFEVQAFFRPSKYLKFLKFQAFFRIFDIFYPLIFEEKPLPRVQTILFFMSTKRPGYKKKNDHCVGN